MKKVAAAEFKARCLAIMEDVRATREPVLITKRGRPLAKLVDAEPAKDDFLGRLEGVFEITGDITSPVNPPEAWEALR